MTIFARLREAWKVLRGVEAVKAEQDHSLPKQPPDPVELRIRHKGELRWVRLIGRNGYHVQCRSADGGTTLVKLITEADVTPDDVRLFRKFFNN